LDASFDLLGRLHPLILHAPLGVAAALALLELWTASRGRELGSRRELALFAAASGALAAASGWLLAEADGRAGETVFRHRWTGIAFAALLVAAAVAARPRRTPAYAIALLLAITAAGFAGHFGATLTHGPGYWASAPPPEAGPGTTPPEGIEPAPTASGPGAPAADLYSDEVHPLLVERCGKCHGPSKQKARLALHTPEGIAGGSFNGPVVVPGDPAASELHRRVSLPLDDEDHMPPEDEPQMTAEEIALLERWIREGAQLPAATPAAPDAPPAGTPADR
jgi:hypothetical protein